MNRLFTFPNLARGLVYLRWVIPGSLAALGIGYVIVEGVWLDRYSVASPPVVIGIGLLGILAPILTFAILTGAIHAERERERQRERLLALNTIGEAVNQSLELDAVLERALERVLEVMRLEAGEVRLIEDGQLVLRASRGVSADFLAAEHTIPLGKCMCGKSAQSGKLIAIEDIGKVPNFATTPCACERFHSVLTVPVRTADRVVGAIHVGSPTARRFDEGERALLTAIGQQVGTAIEKARLHAQLKALNRELEKRVAARTVELVAAKEELARKADALQQILAEERRVEERTRARIAGDLHDSVQQLIIGALFETQAARDLLSPNDDSAGARLLAAQELLRRIETEMRDAIYSLRPVALDAHGLVPALRECAHDFEHAAQIQCHLRVEGTPRRFDPESQVAVFRIIQEALNNIEQHARSQRADIALNFGARDLRVIIADDGIGFDVPTAQDQPRRQLGLLSMRERAESIGGALDVWSEPGKGARVTFIVPITNHEEQ